MNKPASFAIVLTVVGLAFAAGCSTSDGKTMSSVGEGGSSAAAGGGASGAGGSTAASGSGSAIEGKPCRTDPDCATGLSCVISKVGDFGFRHCARSCSKSEPCKDDEMCLTSTGSADDLFCRNPVTTPFKPCGPGDTSYCDKPLTCIFPPEGVGTPVGLCFNFCMLPTSTASMTDPDVLANCPSGQTCADALGDPDLGVCAMTAARGEMCSIQDGKLCNPQDLCVVEDASGSSTCYQDCTKDGTCSNGKPCTRIDTDVSICADP